MNEKMENIKISIEFKSDSDHLMNHHWLITTQHLQLE